MIARPPQQQVHTYHLALSLVILFFTVYPYLFQSNGFSVSAYSSDDFGLKHNHIEKFDIIESDDIIWSKQISTRSTQQETHDASITNLNSVEDSQQVNKGVGFDLLEKRHLQFNSLGQQIRLSLTKSKHVITDDFKIIGLDENGKETKIPFNRNDFQAFEGSRMGDPSSKASASFNGQNKLLTAQIRSGQDIMIVEPTYLHKDKLSSSYSISPDNKTNNNSDTNRNSYLELSPSLVQRTMIVYKLSDYDEFNPTNNKNTTLFEPDKLCAATKISNTTNIDSSGSKTREEISTSKQDQDDSDIFRLYKATAIDGSSRASGKSHLRKRGISHDNHYQTLKDKTRCTLHLVADFLFYKHIGNSDNQTTTNYLLALIHRVNLIYLATKWETSSEKEPGSETFDNIGFVVQDITIHQRFTRSDSFAVASGSESSDIHYNMESDKVWDARKFLNNFSRNSPSKHHCLAHLLTYRAFDSPVLGLAYVASYRWGTIGGICSPPYEDKDGHYYKHNTGISTSKGIHGETLITRQADLVLAHELGHNLGAEHDSNECRPSPSEGGAYLMHPYSVMGFERNNRFLSQCSRLAIGRVIKRKGPTCFIAMDNFCGNGVVDLDRGEECDGGSIGQHKNSDPCCDDSCRFVSSAQCSDKDSFCCHNCRIDLAGRPCRGAEEFNCKQAAICNGRDAQCPEGPPVEDDRVCVGRGLCRGGECQPFCEAQTGRDLHSCLCTNPADACRLCCKQSINGTCQPYERGSPYLPDGVLCHRGVCEKGRCEQPIQDVVERLWDVIEDINFTTLVKFFRDNIILVVLFVSIPIWCLITHFINEFDKRIKRDVINTIIRHRDGKHRGASSTQSPFLPRLFVDGGSTNGSLDDLPQDDTMANQQQPLKGCGGGGNKPAMGMPMGPMHDDNVFQFPPPGGKMTTSRSAPPNSKQWMQRQPHEQPGQLQEQHSPIGFRTSSPHRFGFQMPGGAPDMREEEEEEESGNEVMVLQPPGSIALNSIELPQQQQQHQFGRQNYRQNGNPSNNQLDDEAGAIQEGNSEFDPSRTYSTQV